MFSGNPLFLKVASLSEIRQLDGERQSLVYNRHHELIAASDTISAVRHLPISFYILLDSAFV